MSDLLIGFEEFLEKHKNEIPKKLLKEKNKEYLFLIYTGGFADGKSENEKR